MQVRILPGQLIVIVLALVRLHVSVVKFFLSLSLTLIWLRHMKALLLLWDLLRMAAMVG